MNLFHVFNTRSNNKFIIAKNADHAAFISKKIGLVRDVKNAKSKDVTEEILSMHKNVETRKSLEELLVSGKCGPVLWMCQVIPHCLSLLGLSEWSNRSALWEFDTENL